MTQRGSRLVRATLVGVALAGAVSLTLAGCGNQPTAPENPIATGKYPDYYPADYQGLVDAAKVEGGTLEIYSNIDESNWSPIFRDFKKKYPFVSTINANNIESDEIFQRVLAEEATNGSPADILVSGAAQGWADFTAKGETITPYKSPELGHLPEFAQLLPNVYAISVDPMGLIYNTALVNRDVTGFGSLAEAAAADPAAFRSGFGVRDVGSSFGFTVSHALTAAKPELWAPLKTLLSLGRVETSSGTQSDKVLAGEYKSAFVFSAAPAYPLVARSGGLLKFVLPDDGTVVVPRGIAIGPRAPHPATAKLFLDFVLSEEGQAAVAEGGLTSYRDSVAAAEGRHTYQEVVNRVGKENVILVHYDSVPAAEVDAFTSRWNGIVGSSAG